MPVKNAKRGAARPNGALTYKKRLDLVNFEIDIYRQIGGLIVKGAPRKALLASIMDLVLKALEAECGTLYLVEDGELSFEVVKGPLAGRLKGLKLRAGTGIAGRVARTAEPYISTDLSHDRFWAGVKASGEYRNMMAVPLMRKRKVKGVIEVINKKAGGKFTAGDLRVLKSLANHFSIVMERADLFAELDGRIKQLSALNEVGTLLTSTLDQTVIRHRAMEAVTGLMHAETGSLLLVDAKANELYFEVALGAKGRSLKEIRLGIGEGIAGWVAKNGEPAIIHDVSKDRRFLARMDRKSKFRTRNMICVPVKIKGNVIGVLQAINKIGGRFTREDLKLFQLFANQVAIALDNARLYEEIRDTFYATSGALAEAIEKRDPYTGGHTKRVLGYSIAIANNLRLPKRLIDVVKLSAVLHDIGKIGIEDSILRKDAPLDQKEALAMKMHPIYGAEILKHVPQLKDIVPGMLYHHERFDGKGYPRGYSKEQIPITARIIAVADTYDAMTTTRPYRAGLPPEVAIKELKKYSGTQFDSRVVKAFMRAFEKGEIDGIPRKKSMKASSRKGRALRAKEL